jgi:hypothetical protein
MVSILLATTGRPVEAERCVREVRASTPQALEIVAAVDACEETRKRLLPLVDTLDYREGYRGCSRAWNDALAASTGDPVVLAADDLVFTAGWLEAALNQLAEFPDGYGFVGFNDGHMRDELSTHYLVSRRLIVEAFGGVIAWEAYKHSFNDVEANERARRAGRYAWCEDARVAHTHWLFGDRSADGTDARNLPEHPASEQAFNARRAAGFPDDYEAVIA